MKEELRCEICGETRKGWTELEEHEATHYTMTEVQRRARTCSHCGEEFEGVGSKIRHIQKSHPGFWITETVEKLMDEDQEPTTYYDYCTTCWQYVNKERAHKCGGDPIITDQVRFAGVVRHRQAAIEESLAAKGEEYARGGDRLHNFRRISAFTGKPMRQACWALAMKHITSLQDMVEDDGEHPAEVWDEKLGDAINYLILLDAIVREGQGR